LKPPRKKKKLNASKQKHATEHCMAGLAAQLQLDHFKQVFLDWNDLSLVIRSKVFEKDEMEQIDIHDFKVIIVITS